MDIMPASRLIPPPPALSLLGTSFTSLRFSSPGRTFSAEGILNGIQVKANADTGASFNVISEHLASSLGLTPEPGTRREIRLPSGKKIFSPGKVKGLFKFGNEETSHDLSCVILEKASYPLVLGSKFLRLTRTFTKYMHRLQKVFASGLGLSLNLIGDEHELISGRLNGSRCFAVPDSGSDIMVLSGAYAKAHGLKVRRAPRHRHTVEFIDGSRELTDGVIKDLSWQFREGEVAILCDFHVINNLPVDAILSNALVDERNVFSRYDDILIQIDSAEDQSGVYNIRLADKSREEITRLEESFEDDSESLRPSNVHKELSFYSDIRYAVHG
ncbi:hypothetical protein QQX98_004422 [Neonectria punicea]|uniref:Peptidase A2 domain-containing protein n=1 Tax=Neonectria punicea TaxID=979145 RepID=A0ABR1HAK3_9HYPO